jgi:hypothetical protein
MGTDGKTLHFTPLHYYTTLHYTTLHYTTLHYTTLHYITLQYTTLHSTTLHYTTLHATTLHYTTLHSICDAGDRRERAAAAVVTIGPAVLNGGSTTLLVRPSRNKSTQVWTFANSLGPAEQMSKHKQKIVFKKFGFRLNPYYLDRKAFITVLLLSLLQALILSYHFPSLLCWPSTIDSCH